MRCASAIRSARKAVLAARKTCRLFPGHATEGGADRHADAGDVSLTEDVARHDLAGGKDVGRRLGVLKDYSGVLLDPYSEVGKGDARAQGIGVERGRVERARPARLAGNEALGAAIVETGVGESPGANRCVKAR